MFTEYTNEEIENPLLIKTEGSEVEVFKLASGMGNENTGADTNNYDIKDYNNNEHPYDMEGEGLW